MANPKLFATLALLVSCCTAASVIVNDYEAYQAGAYGLHPNVSFKSTSLAQPLFQISTWDKEASRLAGGYLVMSTPVGDQESGAMILRGDDLSLVHAIVHEDGGADANIQTLDGQSLLTVFGQNIPSHSENWDLLYGTDLELAYNTTTIDMPVLADAHEFWLTEEGNAIVTAYPTISPFDLSAVGGNASSVLLDSCFQELDFRRNVSIFQWCASDHFPVDGSLESYAAGREYDAYHLNAVSKGADDNYLVSSRHLAAIFYVNVTDGSLIWTLGGAYSNFTETVSSVRGAGHEEGYTFQWQHHARFVGDDMNAISLFDNHGGNAGMTDVAGNCEQGYNCSRALTIHVDYDAMTYEVRQVLEHPRAVSAYSMGSNVGLADGSWLVQWGKTPSFTEHDADGNVIMEAEYDLWNGTAFSYRTFWIPEDMWVTNPTTIPDAVVENGIVYASWNGATRVHQWAIVDCATNQVIAKAKRNGFETALSIPMINSTSIVVEALDSQGGKLGRSQKISLSV